MMNLEDVTEKLVQVPVKRNGRRMMRDIPRDVLDWIIDEKEGKIPEIIAMLGVGNGDFYRFLDKNPDVQTALAIHRNNLIDLAESKLEANIKKGDQRAIEFVLDRVGKHRGYGKELTIKDESSHNQIEASIDLSQLTEDELLLLQKLQTKMIPEDKSDRRANSSDEDIITVETVT